MFEYTKQILLKVSFDQGLFRKELMKAMTWLQNDEKRLLKFWCIGTFGALHADVITEAFRNIR